MQLSIILALFACAANLCHGDIYMHNPRGSNNRLNEQSAERDNANRAFDSQNNNRGGYNVGDKTDKAATNQDGQYRMQYFQSGNYLVKTAPNGQSQLVVEWTNQHGCGGNEDTDPHKLNCNVVIQMLCQTDSNSVAPDDGITLRDGIQRTTQAYNKIADTSTKDQFNTRRNQDVNQNRVLQEPWFFYDSCNRRERNKGLFTADQTLKKDEAVSTRQNPNANRNGYECPEERDYFPYWHPTPFVDIAILAQNESMCSYYRDHSANRAPKYACVESFATTSHTKHFSKYTNEANCTANGGTWTEFYSMLELAPQYTTKTACEADRGDGYSYKWAKPWDPKKIDNHEAIEDVCFVQPSPIHCEAAGWTRSNHLGNGREGVPLNYTWIIPYFPSGETKRCIIRVRYNISTDDYDPYNTDSKQNGEDKSPIQQNPLVDVGANGQALRLAINTAQTGRTFQDRSHVFTLVPRPNDFDSDARIINLNVRGKRGNIVQTYPAVEYDFIPNRFTMKTSSDYLHIQWTGSNTHNNGNPGGDGQTGDAGEGTKGTDRHNMAQTGAADLNYPLPVEAMTMHQNMKVMWSADVDKTLTQDNLALILATAGYYECIETCGNSVDARDKLNNQLNNAPASFKGVVIRFEAAGEYFFICTRNNNFTNRSQKGHIKVE